MQSLKKARLSKFNPAGHGSQVPGRIVLVISSLKAGGAERVMALLANEWEQRGRPVTLITLGDADDFYPLAPEVERVALDLLRPSQDPIDALRNNWLRLRELRRAILRANPAGVISFMDSTNILTLLASRRLGVPVIVSERIDPRHYAIGRGWAIMRKKLYRWASAVVVQTNAVAEWVRDFVPVEKVHVIPNPIAPPARDVALAEPAPDWLPAKPFIAGMGRLDEQKGFDLLLQAFAQIVPRWPDLQLVIMGEGAERLKLEALARDLKIDDRVVMPGRISSAWPVLARCQCFVLSSRFEGFPNVLLEAMAMGAPVISFACPSGPSDIVDSGADGILVPVSDTSALIEGIEKVLSDENLKSRLSTAAQDSILRYSIAEITSKWEALLL